MIADFVIDIWKVFIDIRSIEVNDLNVINKDISFWHRSEVCCIGPRTMRIGTDL